MKRFHRWQCGRDHHKPTRALRRYTIGYHVTCCRWCGKGWLDVECEVF